uniref:Uncharacterized protein n=1 Tax=Haemonchus contortus TaxID=6289 RepID=A0A7I4YWE9_HAECO
MIPAVASTLPFAEQMAKKRKAEALEASLHQPPHERTLFHLLMMTPRCGPRR